MNCALPTLRGDRVALRPLQDGDADHLADLVLQPEVARWWGSRPDDREHHRAGFVEDAAGSEAWAIEVDGALAGWLGVYEEEELDYRHGGLDIFIDPALHGAGHGPQALRLAARWLVDERGHHRLIIDPAAANERAIAVYEGLGFRRVGVMRSYERGADGEWHDSLLMDMLAGGIARMTSPVLSARELNRATLARQMLLERAEDVAVPVAVERLAGMQAQEPKHPYVGLWTRVAGFEAEALRVCVAQREVVRATLMRSTLHVCSAADYVALRLALQPPRSVALRVLGARAEGLDADAVVAATRELLAGRPLTFDAIRAGLQERFPDVNDRALGYAARTLVPLVMAPGGSDARWGYPRVCEFALAEEFLDGSLAPAAPAALVERYLGAFGPASAADVGAWSGIGGMKGVLDGMRDRLTVFADERGRELFDLPDAPRPGAGADAPARFLPEFDNLVLAYDDRTRLIADEHRPLVTTKNLRVKATFLVDGVVAGTYSVAVKRRVATVSLQPFGSLAKQARAALEREGEALARFAEPEAKGYAVTAG